MAPTRPRARALARLLLAAACLSIGLTGVGPVAHPPPVVAGVAESIEADLLRWVNAARASRGLVPLRLHTGLVGLAGDRAASMAASGSLKHPSCLSCMLTSRGIQWYSVGEVIAATTYPWGDQAAQSIFNRWKGSSLHWGLLMSAKFNYVGFGVAYRSSNKSTWAAAVLSESKDRTKPWAKISGSSRSGSTVTWQWRGADMKLQTHTSGLDGFDVQYRVGSGTWSTIRSDTTATSLSLSGRAGGRYYGLRIRARDHRGNVSAYSAEVRIWVP
jgi:uncharacterized protein YkwD